MSSFTGVHQVIQNVFLKKKKILWEKNILLKEHGDYGSQFKKFILAQEIITQITDTHYWVNTSTSFKLTWNELN